MANRSRDLQKFRSTPVIQQSFPEFISQVVEDIARLPQAIGELISYFKKEQTYIAGLIGLAEQNGAPKEVIDYLSTIHDSIGSAVETELPETTDNIGEVVNKIQNIMHLLGSVETLKSALNIDKRKK